MRKVAVWSDPWPSKPDANPKAGTVVQPADIAAAIDQVKAGG